MELPVLLVPLVEPLTPRKRSVKRCRMTHPCQQVPSRDVGCLYPGEPGDHRAPLLTRIHSATEALSITVQTVTQCLVCCTGTSNMMILFQTPNQIHK